MKVYICSSRKGDPDKISRKFEYMEKKLKKLGLTPINPLRQLEGQSIQLRLAKRDDQLDKPIIDKFGESKRRQYLEATLLSAIIAQCDQIYLEFDWDQDINCLMEFMYAKLIGLPTIVLVNGEIKEIHITKIDFKYLGEKEDSNLIDPDFISDDYRGAECYDDYERGHYPIEKGEEEAEESWKKGVDVRDIIKPKPLSEEDKESRDWFEKQIGLD